MRHVYKVGERAELVVGGSVELVTVRDTWACQHREVEDSAGRKFVVSEGALRPALPDDFEMKDASGDPVHVSCRKYTDGQYRVCITAGTVDLTPDQADHLAHAVLAMSRASRGREER